MFTYLSHLCLPLAPEQSLLLSVAVRLQASLHDATLHAVQGSRLGVLAS